MKQSTKLARYAALTNAAEMIRGHGEEGGAGERDHSDFMEDEYVKQAEKVYQSLMKQAQKLLLTIDNEFI